MDPFVKFIEFISWLPGRHVIRIEVAIGIRHGIVGLKHHPQFLFSVEVAALREEKLNRVVRVCRRFLIADKTDGDRIEHRIKLRFQKAEAREDANPLAVTLPHMERLCFENLPAGYEIPFAVLAEKRLLLNEPQLVAWVVPSKPKLCSDVFV